MKRTETVEFKTVPFCSDAPAGPYSTILSEQHSRKFLENPLNL